MKAVGKQRLLTTKVEDLQIGKEGKMMEPRRDRPQNQEGDLFNQQDESNKRPEQKLVAEIVDSTAL